MHGKLIDLYLFLIEGITTKVVSEHGSLSSLGNLFSIIYRAKGVAKGRIGNQRAPLLDKLGLVLTLGCTAVCFQDVQGVRSQ